MKKGFTLVELIAVIAVLGAILAVVVPNIRDVVSDSTKKSFKINARNFLEVIETKIKEDDDFNPENINIDNLKEELNISNDNYKSVSIVEEERYTYISLVGKGKWDGLVACGTFDDMKILDDVSECHADSNPPVITLLGNDPVSIYVNTSYTDAGATATDKEDGDLTSKIVITGSVNPSVPGSYSVTYSVTDSSNNKTTLTRTVRVIDNELPTITFGTNGNSTYAKTRSTTVTVKDAGGVNASSLKYLWNTSTTTLTESSFASATSFTNGGTITTPAGVTGSYYLWIIGKDTAGNTKISRSNVFNLDNTAPVITIIGNSTITLLKGTTYIDQGATATDNIDTGVTVTSTGTVNSGVIGIYTITYNATDSSGNVATSKTRTINVVDVSAPVITMLGSNPVTLQCGTAYADAGATAVDDVDGNVTSKITATSTVNPNIVGTYYVTYTVKDNTGNTATLTRTVNVVDTIAPTYTSYAITNVTYSGYDIYVYGVSDSGSGVNRVQFPTWTDLNGGDDMQPSWQTNPTASGTNLGNGTWYYRVNITDHNNESDQYQTHVYLYDNQGNTSSFATSGAFLEPEVPAGWIPIRTPEDLNNIRNNLSGYYYVVRDIDLSTSAYSTWTPINNFVGKLDGANHKIIGLRIINGSGSSNTGFFGVIGTSEIKNIEFVNAYISSAGLTAGTLAGDASNAALTLTNVKVNSAVNGEGYVGGIIGKAFIVIMNNCSSSGSVYGTYYSGGLIGYVSSGAIDINNSYSSSTVYGSGSAGGLIGAFNGFNTTATESLGFNPKITKSYATGDVYGIRHAGGLIGYTNLDYKLVISKSYTTNNVTLTSAGSLEYIGGLIGKTIGAKLNDVYAVGTVNIVGDGVVTYAGGLMGYNGGFLTRAYTLGRINIAKIYSNNIDPVFGGSGTGNSYVYWNNNTATVPAKFNFSIGYGRTTAQMYQQSTYTGFDFTNVWYASGTSYPTLR